LERAAAIVSCHVTAAPPENDSHSRHHPPQSDWMAGSFGPIDDVSQAVWKSGGNGSASRLKMTAVPYLHRDDDLAVER
jgi:hypothetical protein